MRTRTLIAIVCGLATFGATLGVLGGRGAGPLSSVSIPQDVLARSDIARAHMLQIYYAMLTCANEYDGSYPPDLRMLYPDPISDSTVFWHPGDTDPPPTTIDNNEPDQPNSTRISFEFTASPSSEACHSTLVIWDNSAANNGGLFVNRLRGDDVFETDPPFVTPAPARLQAAQANLRALYRALASYASYNRDWYPTDPAWLLDGYTICSPRSFWNPGDSDPEPTEITNSIPDAPNSAQISYDFLTTGHRLAEFGPDDIIVRDNTAANNGGQGVNVIRADGRIELVFVCNDPFADADWDGDVDQSDFGWLQRCFNPAGEPMEETCECFDRPELPAFPDGDGDVDLDDYQRFEACASGPDIPLDPGCDDE